MPRFLSVWLPSWPTQRLRRLDAQALDIQAFDVQGGNVQGGSVQESAASPPPDAPLATVESVRGVRRLAAVCPVAAGLGLRPEQALAQARAMCPALMVADADPAADRAALARLAAWCERYTPLAAADPPDGLWLDVEGCDHLYGGEAGLAADLAARLAGAGLAARMGIASATGAAWAAARSPTARADCTRVAAGEEARALGVLPVALLRLDARTVAGLRRVGLRSIGEVARLPRGELAARYGAATLLRLDQAHGRAAEAIAWPHPPAPWQERLAFAEPIGTPEDLRRALDLLAARLCARLEARSRGGTRFTATFLRVDDTRPAITIATALAVRDPAYVARLLAARLETVDPGFGVDAVLLAADATEPLGMAQGRLGALAAGEETALAATVDEVANRIGAARLWRAARAGSHVPERAVRRIPPLAPREGVRGAGGRWAADPSRERPVRLLRTPEPIEALALVPDEPPVQFRWRGLLHRVRAADGPERIAPEWWRVGGPVGEHGGGSAMQERAADNDPVRDYYRVEDAAGARFWIFRAGLMGGERPARWFLHGLFG